MCGDSLAKLSLCPHSAHISFAPCSTGPHTHKESSQKCKTYSRH